MDHFRLAYHNRYHLGISRRTGGSEFGSFRGGDPGRPVFGDQAAAASFARHRPMKEQDYTFSRARE